MPLESYICDLDPDTKTNLKLYLFKNVKNSEDIKNKIVSGLWNCTAIKPSLILNEFQVAVAANRAVVAEKAKTMITRSVYTEILYNLSLTNNIAQSLKKFGIETDTSLLICFLVRPDEDNSNDIVKQIDGETCLISDLTKFTNMKDVKTAYKLHNLKCNVDLLDVIVSRMVTKKFVSY